MLHTVVRPSVDYTNRTTECREREWWSSFFAQLLQVLVTYTEEGWCSFLSNCYPLKTPKYLNIPISY